MWAPNKCTPDLLQVSHAGAPLYPAELQQDLDVKIGITVPDVSGCAVSQFSQNDF